MPSLSDQNSLWVLPWSDAWTSLPAQESALRAERDRCNQTGSEASASFTFSNRSYLALRLYGGLTLLILSYPTPYNWPTPIHLPALRDSQVTSSEKLLMINSTT